jgi:Haloacid dehalogenase-like hydrolase
MITAIERLRALQLRLLICTARPRRTAVQTLQHLGVTGWFEAIHGAEEDGGLEAKQDLLSVLMAQHHLNAGSAVMVGDGSSDITAARAHGMRAIAVTWGYGSLCELIDARPFALCERPSTLVSIVRRLVFDDGTLQSRTDTRQDFRTSIDGARWRRTAQNAGRGGIVINDEPSTIADMPLRTVCRDQDRSI